MLRSRSQPAMHLVAQAGNAVEALVEFRRHRPDIGRALYPRVDHGFQAGGNGINVLARPDTLT
jgi:hypothetical protein